MSGSQFGEALVTSPLISALVRDDKNVDVLIAETLHSFVKLVRTVDQNSGEMATHFNLLCSISETLLVRRALANYAVTAKACA